MATSKYYRLVAGRPIPDKEFDEAVIPAADRDKLPVPFTFIYTGGFAANQTDVELYEAVGTFQRLTMPAAGSVVKMTLQSSAARTAGTLTAEPTKAGVDMGDNLDLVLDAGTTQNDYAEVAPDTANMTFVAGDQLGVHLSSDATWAPVTSDIEIVIFVVFDS